MGFNAFHYGVNAVCFQKNERKYGMICSWATQVDYDRIVLLLGAQSVREETSPRAISSVLAC